MYVNTGIERCKTLSIAKSVDGVTLSGYPKTYSILIAFTANSNSYGVLTETEFKQLPEADYLNRLADFEDYVSAAEDYVDIDANTESGWEAYRENTSSCPIGDI